MENTPESFPNPILHKQMHPALQFITIIVLTLFALFVGSIVAGAIIYASFGEGVFKDVMSLNISSDREANAMWILQLLGTTLPLLITPVFFSYVIVREPDDYLKTTFHYNRLLLLVVFAVMILSAPLMEFLSNINQHLNLPQWMRDEENTLDKASESMMQMKTFGSMVFDLVFIGLVTAVAEEFLFRGCLQTILIRLVKNKHVAIWITAILFSAFHMEFFGFIPRLMLGLFFGYFTAWSGSIWPSVWAHFVNNGLVVILTYLSQHKLISINLDDQHLFNNAGYIISFIITLLLLFVYRRITSRAQIADLNGEELD